MSITSEEILDIAFGIAGNSHPLLGEGWAEGEKGFTWIVGSKATLLIPRPAEPCDCRLAITLTTYRPPHLIGQRLQISLGKTCLVNVIITEPLKLEIWIPASAIEVDDDPMILAFYCPDASRPSEHIPSTDDRPLAFMIQKLSLSRLTGLADPSMVSLCEIAWSIESLGSNCEAGVVQRRCGAEPLGLLRFAQGDLSALLGALEAQFDGLGEVDHIDLILEGRPGHREWRTIDRCYGFHFHTWTHEHMVSREDILHRESRRIPRLVKKLLSDLREGQKLFVFHDPVIEKADAAIPLLQAIKRYGPNTLLAILVDPALAGTVEWHSPGLLVGYLDRKAPPGLAGQFSWGSWAPVLRQAHDLWSRARDSYEVAYADNVYA